MKFTKGDLEDGDIVTQRNGSKKTFNIIEDRFYGLGESAELSLDNYRDDLSDKDGDTQYDIIKVERTTGYKTIFERGKEILDETEKEYLKAIIRPFRNRVIGITKEECGNKQYISIDIKNDSSIDLPIFKAGTMYRGMKAGYTYSLEELEL